jgi:hypothetical protein
MLRCRSERHRSLQCAAPESVARLHGVRLDGPETGIAPRPELLEQNLLRYADNLLFKLAYPLGPAHQDVDDDCLPASGQDAERALDGQAGKSLRDIHDTHQMVGGLSNSIALMCIVKSGRGKNIDGCTIRQSRAWRPAPAEQSHRDGTDDQNADLGGRCAQRASAGLIVTEATDVSARSKGYAWTPRHLYGRAG